MVDSLSVNRAVIFFFRQTREGLLCRLLVYSSLEDLAGDVSWGRTSLDASRDSAKLDEPEATSTRFSTSSEGAGQDRSPPDAWQPRPSTDPCDGRARPARRGPRGRRRFRGWRRRRVALAAVSSANDLLLLDEQTNHSTPRR